MFGELRMRTHGLKMSESFRAEKTFRVRHSCAGVGFEVQGSGVEVFRI